MNPSKGGGKSLQSWAIRLRETPSIMLNEPAGGCPERSLTSRRHSLTDPVSVGDSLPWLWGILPASITSFAPFLLSFPFYTACKMFSRGLQTSAGPITSARKEAPMTCPRCDGLLLATLPLVWSSSNYQPSPGDEPDLQAWGCMNCGNYLDAVILTHRSASHPLAEVSPEPLAA